MIQFLSIVNLLIAAQAAFLFVHFMMKQKGVPVVNRILALLCLCFSLLIANTYLALSGNADTLPYFQLVANHAMWFIGPCMYLYARHIKKPPSVKMALQHTLPYLLFVPAELVLRDTVFVELLPFIAFTQMLVYLGTTLLFIKRHYGQARRYYHWILPSVISFLFLVLVNTGLRIAGLMDIPTLPQPIIQSFTTVLAFPIFYMAYKEMNQQTEERQKTTKYKTSPLSEEKQKAILQLIRHHMETEKVYLDTTLNLTKFSKMLQVPSKYISQVINAHHQESFSDHLTRYRMEEVKLRLKDPGHQKLTIAAIAQDSGFPSASRFNVLFKKHTGLTPSQFKNQQA